MRRDSVWEQRLGTERWLEVQAARGARHAVPCREHSPSMLSQQRRLVDFDATRAGNTPLSVVAAQVTEHGQQNPSHNAIANDQGSKGVLKVDGWQ